MLLQERSEQRPGSPNLRPDDMIEVPTANGGVRLMQAGAIASCSVQEFNEMRQVLSTKGCHCKSKVPATPSLPYRCKACVLRLYLRVARASQKPSRASTIAMWRVQGTEPSCLAARPVLSTRLLVSGFR